MPCMSVIEPPETGGDLILVPSGGLEEVGRSGSGSDLDCSFYRFSKEPVISPSPAESSSIGKNSDEEEEEEGENEVQGPLRGGFKASMDSLEEALPMRRGISSFYEGKSKSFASLADASSSRTIKSIVKPETAYSRKRRNLLAHTLLSENNHHKITKLSHLIKTHGGCISKKPNSFTSSSNRAALEMAIAMANINTTPKPKTSVFNDHASGMKSRDLGPSPLSPMHHVMGVHSRVGGGGGGGVGGDCMSPLSLRSFCHWRSFSLADLQQCHPAVGSDLRPPDHIS